MLGTQSRLTGSRPGSIGFGIIEGSIHRKIGGSTTQETNSMRDPGSQHWQFRTQYTRLYSASASNWSDLECWLVNPRGWSINTHEDGTKLSVEQLQTLT